MKRLPSEKSLRGVCCLLGLLPVAPLLIWLYGIGSYALWWWVVAIPSALLLLVIAALTMGDERYPKLRAAFIAGVVGGLAGLLAYDLFRVPFYAAGIQLFAPIDSFGMLMLSAKTSSHATQFAGWFAHFADGLGFGIAYAMVALGRRWWWGILWGVTLEAATLVTPYASAYGLTGKWGLIGIAIAGHLAYGAALGIVVQHGDKVAEGVREVSPWTAIASVIVVTIGLAIWAQPWKSGPDERTPGEVSAGVHTAVLDTEFIPAWVRVGQDGCITVSNHDDTSYVLTGARDEPTLPANGTVAACLEGYGVKRVKLDGKPWTGGFIMLDRDYVSAET